MSEHRSTTIDDPLAGSAWSRPETVAGFTAAAPNGTLMRFAAIELERTPHGRALDLGCGVGRNALPLAERGWSVLGLDLSSPMLQAAACRALDRQLDDRCKVALAPMDRLPVADGSCDLLIAHGIWNLARSSAEFRAALREAARVAAPGAALFVFTFSRNTLPSDAQSVARESFVFTQLSGEPQCFLTADELVSELASVGFAPDAAVPLRELNKREGRTVGVAPPVIYEGTFRYAT